MRSRTKFAIGLLVVVIAVILSRPVFEFLDAKGVISTEKPSPVQNPEALLGKERSEMMSPGVIIKLMNPKPTDTILDLGAGYGLFTFPLAKTVAAGGKVYATEVDPIAVNLLNERIRKESISNVFPVQVSLSGLDPFYTKHSFDIILASDVFVTIKAPVPYFNKLRSSLKEGSGRLWVVDLLLDPDFTAVEFSDSKTLREALNSHRAQATIVPRLSSAAKKALTSSASGSADQLAELVAADLNYMLEDSTLWGQIGEQKLELNQKDAILRNELSKILERAGTFKTGPNKETSTLLRLLNRLVLMELSGTDVWSKVGHLNNLNERQVKSIIETLKSTDSSQPPPVFKKTGYELVQEHKAVPYLRIWEFKRAR